MATLKRIGPGSAFKLGAIIYAILGFIIGIPFAFIGMLAGSFLATRAPIPGVGLGFFSIILFPICYGIIGGVFGALTAVIYNLAAGWIGGLEVDVS
jgi:hypothetical protein